MIPKCSLDGYNSYLQILALLFMIIILVIVVSYYLQATQCNIMEKYQVGELDTSTIEYKTAIDAGNRSTYPQDKYPGAKMNLIADTNTASADASTTDVYGLRDCKVYFTDDINSCDNQVESSTKTCSYKFDGWKEFDTYKDNNGNTLTYPKKKYNPNASNTSELINSHFTSKCFKEFDYNGKGSAKKFEYKENVLVKYDSKGIEDNTQIDTNVFGGKKYTSIQFMNSDDATDNLTNVIDSICSIKYNPIRALTGKTFYKFNFDTNKNIISIHKLALNNDQSNFNTVNSVAINDFAILGSHGLRFNDNGQLQIFINETDIITELNIYKFTYVTNLCANSQIKNFIKHPSRRIKITDFLKFGATKNNALTERIITDIGNLDIISNKDSYKGRNGTKYIDYKKQILDDLETKRQETAKYLNDASEERKRIYRSYIDSINKRANLSFNRKNAFAIENNTFLKLLTLERRDQNWSRVRIFNYASGFKNKLLNDIPIPEGSEASFLNTSDICLIFKNNNQNQTSYSFTVPSGKSYLCDILVVGGKGGGGNAGNYVYNANINIDSGTYNINVGKRGNNTYDKGFDSSFTGGSKSYIAYGGGDGWTLVRRVPAGRKWHPTNDGLAGKTVYGTYSSNPQDNNIGSGWSINFENAVPGYNEFKFATGNEQVWLITTKAAIGGDAVSPPDYYANVPRTILSSSDSSRPYTALWYNRSYAPEDPWISVGDHGTAVRDNKLLYGENTFGAGWGHENILTSHNGANVFIRNSNKSAESSSQGNIGTDGLLASYKNGGDRGSGIVIIIIKNIIPNQPIISDTDSYYKHVDNPVSTVTIPSLRIQTSMLTSFVYLQKGFYRFRADIGNNGGANPNIVYAELMIYDENNRVDSQYNCLKVFKYNIYDNKYAPSYLMPYVEIATNQLYKMVYTFYYSNNTSSNISNNFQIYYNYLERAPENLEGSLPSGVIAWYRFNGNGLDFSPSVTKYNLQANYGSPTYPNETWQGRKFINTASGSLRTPISLARRAFSVAVWQRRKHSSRALYIAQATNWGPNLTVLLGPEFGNTYMIAFHNNDLVTRAFDDVNKWVHIVYVVSPNFNRKIYRNGVLVASDSNTAAANAEGNLRIGAEYWNNNGTINIDISDLIIFNREITADEVVTLFNDPPNGTQKGTSLSLMDTKYNNDSSLYGRQNMDRINTPLNEYLFSGKVVYDSYNNPDMKNIFSSIRFVNNIENSNNPYEKLTNYLTRDDIDYFDSRSITKEKDAVQQLIDGENIRLTNEINNNNNIRSINTLTTSIKNIDYKGLLPINDPQLLTGTSFLTIFGNNENDYITFDKVSNLNNLANPRLSQAVYIEALN